MKMKLLYNLMMISLMSTITHATKIDGRFEVLVNNGTHFSVMLQVNTDTGIDDLGSSTIVLEYNNIALFFPANPINGSDFEYQNFSGGNYSISLMTHPLPNQIRVNIELLLNNMGTVVALSPGQWTNILRINFGVLDSLDFAGLTWKVETTEIFDGDNYTQWEKGVFLDILNAPLPGELNSITAKQSDSSIALFWETATEVNNFGFNIEHFSEKIGVWEYLGFVEGNGNSNIKSRYSFIDKNPVNGKNLYRLKQIDNDGLYDYSNIIEIFFAKQFPSEYSLSGNYPNPFNPSTKIKFSIPKNGSESQNILRTVSLSVYDILGNLISEIISDEYGPGYYEVEFNGKKLTSGIYIYRLNVSNEFVSTKKMCLIK